VLGALYAPEGGGGVLVKRPDTKDMLGETRMSDSAEHMTVQALAGERGRRKRVHTRRGGGEYQILARGHCAGKLDTHDDLSRHGRAGAVGGVAEREMKQAPPWNLVADEKGANPIAKGRRWRLTVTRQASRAVNGPDPRRFDSERPRPQASSSSP
jgi:hypothetical protein